MFNRAFSALALVVVTLVVGTASAEAPKSGPKVGERIMPFHALNCTGEHAGEKHCLICENGDNPVAIVFARQVTPELVSLIKWIDQSTGRNKARSMGSIIVLLNDSDNLEEELKELAKKEKIRHAILTIDHPDGPEGYNIAKEAEVTVVLYSKHTVRANHTFKKGGLNAKAIDAVAADLAMILAK